MYHHPWNVFKFDISNTTLFKVKLKLSWQDI